MTAMPLSAIDAGAAIGYTVRHETYRQEQLRLPKPAPVGVPLRRQDGVACPDGDGPGSVFLLPRAPAPVRQVADDLYAEGDV